MFFQIFIRGNLWLWWQGNMPHNLRRLWRERHWWGTDPVMRSVLAHVFFTISVVTFVSFIVFLVTVAAGVINLLDRLDRREWLAELWIMLFVVSILSFFGGLISTKEVSQRFYHNLLDAKDYLGLSFREIDILSYEGLRHHAEENLRNYGRKLRTAESQLPSFHPETEKLREDFKSRYTTFLTLGMIKDVGYGSFIPAK